MPSLRPFRGLRYAPARVPDLTPVLCPPYDVISIEERQRLLARDPANAVRLELPAPTTASATAQDFGRAAAALDGWLADGTLRRDESPMVYVYEQHYATAAGPAVARSFFCELRLEAYSAGGIQPHERTLAAPREHRFRLLEAVRTHLSPVLLLYDDEQSGRHSAELLAALTETPALVDALGPGEVGQRLWAVDPEQSEAARELLALAARRPLTIADGHHRYETALRYRDATGSPPAADHVLALLYEGHSGGLALAPWQRLVSGVGQPQAVLAAAAQLFEVSRADSDENLVAALAQPDEPGRGALAIWTRDGGALLEFDRARLREQVHAGATGEVPSLDVSLLSGTLRQMIGSTEAELSDAGRLAYMHDPAAAIASVERGAADVCYLLRAPSIDSVLRVAAAGEYMPPKSTYFYPKAATGLVFDPLA